MRISTLAGLLWIALPGLSEAQCTPSPTVQAAIDDLPIRLIGVGWQKYDDALHALRTRFPDDLFVQRLLIQTSRRKFGDDKVLAEYKTRYEKSPDDPVVAYLYGLALQGRESKESIRLFVGALAKSPGFAWPHLGLTAVYSMPVFLNREEGLKHLQAFLSACPDSLEGYSRLRDIDDKSVLAAHAAALRTLLSPRTDKQAIGAYPTLWSLEFKVRPLSEYDGLRKQVGEDLRRIRALGREGEREWYYTLEEGYKLVKDQKQADWAHDERQRRLPESWELFSRSQWHKDHPRPNDDDPGDKKRTYFGELFKQTDQWSKERPGMARIWSDRLAAARYLDDVSAADVRTAAETYLRLTMQDAGPDGPSSYQYFTVAQVLSGKHLDPARVVEIAQKGRAKLAEESAQPMFDGYATKENLQDSRFYQASERVTGSEYEASGYIDGKQPAKARLVLTRMDDELQALKSVAGNKADNKKEYMTRLANWWALMARTAELEGHDQDAMAFYEHALLTRIEARQTPETGLKDEIADGARRMWAKLGGSNEGWQLWYGRQADILATRATLTWDEANEALPAFELTDLKGKKWTQAYLKGKTTFLNFWATW